MKFLPMLMGVCLLAQDLVTPPPNPDEARAESFDRMLASHREYPSGLDAVVLRTDTKDYLLDGVVGSFGSTFAFVTVLFYSDFPETKAPVQVKDANPRIYISYSGSLRGKVFLVRAKSNDGANTRSVKMGKSGYGSISSMTSPDQDWVIPVKTSQVREGVWELVPEYALATGEYGIFASVQAGNMGAGGGELFDFGVTSDAPKHHTATPAPHGADRS